MIFFFTTDLVKFVICNLVSRVLMKFYILRPRYTVPRNQGTQFLETRVHMTNLARSNVTERRKLVWKAGPRIETRNMDYIKKSEEEEKTVKVRLLKLLGNSKEPLKSTV